jgi:hypothetical protein
MLELLEQPSVAQTWSAAGQRRQRDRFTAERMVREIDAIYQESLIED